MNTTRRAAVGALLTLGAATRPFLAGGPIACDERGVPIANATVRAFRVGDVAATLVAAPGRTPGALFDVGPSESPVIVLEPARPIVGRVRDADERPVEGARVRLRAAFCGEQVETSTRTDALGEFILNDAPAPSSRRGWSQSTLLDFSADGYAPVFLARPWPGDPGDPGTEPLEIALLRGCELRGLVRDAATGAGVAGARVFLWTTRDETAPDLRETNSAADGSFGFTSAPCEGPHDDLGWNSLAAVGVVAPGRSSEVVDVPRAADGETVDLEIALGPAASVTGHVVDVAGRPVKGVWVSTRAEWRAGGAFPLACGAIARPHTTTDADGRYRLDGVRAESAEVAIAAWRLAPERGSERFAEAVAVVTLPAGSTIAAPDLVVPAIARADVRVTAEDGSPIRGAIVSAYWSGDSCGTDRAGRARVECRTVGEGARLVVPVSAPGYALRFASVDRVPASGHADLDVELEHGRRISGRVTSLDGDPLPGALVTVYRDHPGDERFVPEFGGIDTLAVLETDGDGGFEAVDLPNVPLYVIASAAASSPNRCQRPSLFLRGLSPDARDLHFPLRAHPGGWPKGEVIVRLVDDATGRTVLAPFEATLGCASRPDVIGPGSARFRRVPLVPHEARVMARGYFEALSEPIAPRRAGESVEMEMRLVRDPAATPPADRGGCSPRSRE